MDCTQLRAEILRARNTGRIICGELFSSVPSLSSAARCFELDSDPTKYRDCSQREARFIAERVISHHLVDDGRLVSDERSEELAAAFLERFPVSDARFFTNGEFRELFGVHFLGSWSQVTPERSSSGILVLCESRCGALWVADSFVR
jgi:hypothetical protein